MFVDWMLRLTDAAVPLATAGAGENKRSVRSMFDHISIGVKSLEVARRFYDAALRPLGYERLSNADNMVGYGAERAAFWVGEVERPVPADRGSGLHFCFVAP